MPHKSWTVRNEILIIFIKCVCEVDPLDCPKGGAWRSLRSLQSPIYQSSR